MKTDSAFSLPIGFDSILYFGTRKTKPISTKWKVESIRSFKSESIYRRRPTSFLFLWDFDFIANNGYFKHRLLSHQQRPRASSLCLGWERLLFERQVSPKWARLSIRRKVRRGPFCLFTFKKPSLHQPFFGERDLWRLALLCYVTGELRWAEYSLPFLEVFFRGRERGKDKSIRNEKWRRGQHLLKTLIQNHNGVILITTSLPSRGGMCYILDVGVTTRGPI